MRSARKWIWINLRIGAMSFGGSGRMMLFQDALVVEEKWVTNEEFLECLTIAQILPGPNLVNLSACLSRKLFPQAWVVPAAVVALTLPGALLGLALVAAADLSRFDHLLQGFSLGSLALFLIFLLRMGSGALGRGSVAIFRGALSLCVAATSLAGMPLLYSLAGGIAAALVLEFTWNP